MGGSDPSDQEDTIEPVVNPLAQYHPCYFHMRVVGKADYFIISSLKDKEKEQFRISFINYSERDLFTEVIRELCLERANYQELKTLVYDNNVTGALETALITPSGVVGAGAGAVGRRRVVV